MILIALLRLKVVKFSRFLNLAQTASTRAGTEVT